MNMSDRLRQLIEDHGMQCALVSRTDGAGVILVHLDAQPDLLPGGKGGALYAFVDSLVDHKDGEKMGPWVTIGLEEDEVGDGNVMAGGWPAITVGLDAFQDVDEFDTLESACKSIPNAVRVDCAGERFDL